MRILSAAVLTMEAFVMGFAVLLAMGEHTGSVLTLGGVIAIAALLTAGLMKKRIGWIIGSILQVAMIGYGYFVTSMYFMGRTFCRTLGNSLSCGPQG